MVQFRDIVLKQQSRFETKQDRQLFKRAVLVTSGGLQTSTNPLNDVWYNQSEARVWYMAEGATQPAQILCRKVSNPYVGLGVIIGYADGSNEKEVLTTDFFLTHSGDVSGWDATGPQDLEPGGIKQMWVYTKVIVPLATYPGTGLSVTVTEGDYIYNGTRVTFPGYIDFLLTAPGTPGEHYLAGLYLDSANSLQVVYGSAVSTALDAPEPTWPAGAFQLSAVLIENGQTTIDFADDIFDRRMAWTDTISSSPSAWPKPGKINIGTTEYSTFAAACAAAVSGDLIKLGEGTFACNEVTLPDGVNILGSGIEYSTLNASNPLSTYALDIAGYSVMQSLRVVNAYDTAIRAQPAEGDLSCHNISVFGGINVNSPDFSLSLYDCYLSDSGTDDSLTIAGGATATIYGGQVQTITTADNVTTLYGPRLTGTIAGTLAAGSWWVANGNQIRSSYFRQFQLMGS